MKRSDFFKGAWLSPLALVRGPEELRDRSSTIDAQRDAALADVLQTTGEIFNVKSFGAIGDGITDDTAAIEAADAAACAGTLGIDGATTLAEGTVYFPPGTYRHTGLTYRGAPWAGGGRNVCTLAYSGSGASVNAVGTNRARKLLSISDIALDGRNASTGAYGLDLGHNQRSLGALNRVHITRFPSWGIYFSENAWIISFNDVYLSFNADEENSGIGVAPEVTALNAIEWYHLVLENNGTAESGVGGGIELNGSALLQWSFYGGTWEGNLGAAEARFIDCDAVVIDGLYLESDLAANGATDGLVFGGDITVRVSGCWFAAVRSHVGKALTFSGTSRASLDSCWFHSTRWSTHISVEDTAQVALLSEGNLSTAHSISVEAGAALLRTKPVLITLTEAASVAVDASSGEVFRLRLTANRTIAAPTNPSEGQRITFIIDQDEDGGHRVTWASPDFKTNWSDRGNGASNRCTISFRYFDSRWNQEGAQSAYY